MYSLMLRSLREQGYVMLARSGSQGGGRPLVGRGVSPPKLFLSGGGWGALNEAWSGKIRLAKEKLISVYLINKWKENRMETLPLEVTRAASDLRAVLGRLSRRLRQTGIGGEMTLSQASVLSLIEREGPATPGALAARERISPQSMGSILISLEALGLISRTPDPTDGRRLIIALTGAGSQIIHGARRQKEERLAQALADHFTAEEQQKLIAALPLLERLARLI